MITHKHHIIPKHIGGRTDDPSNLIEQNNEFRIKWPKGDF